MPSIFIAARQGASAPLSPACWEQAQRAARVLAALAQSQDPAKLDDLRAAREYLLDQAHAEMDHAIAAQERIDLDRSTPPGAGSPPSMRL